eukprot:28022-Lingulodinium_polyedra.AAC.1
MVFVTGFRACPGLAPCPPGLPRLFGCHYRATQLPAEFWVQSWLSAIEPCSWWATLFPVDLGVPRTPNPPACAVLARAGMCP